MPFRIDLVNIQRPKVWTSRVTEDALELQRLFDLEDAQGYAEKLAALRTKIPDRSVHDFRLTDGKIYEIFDEGQTMDVSIQFMVKGSVITWSFLAPKDETHQDWRDEIFNTAAIAHQSVDLGCETYYRGSNAYHLKKMHSHAGESEFNHNHYRLVNDHPITPVEVEQHLRAFYAQAKGKKFIPNPHEVDALVYKYKTYWAEYEMDPRYSAYYPLTRVRDNEILFKNLLETNAPKARDAIIEQFLLRMKVDESVLPTALRELSEAFAALEHLPPLDEPTIGRLIRALEEVHGADFSPQDIAAEVAQAHNLSPKEHGDLLIALDSFVRKVNFSRDFQDLKGYPPPADNQVNESSKFQEYQTIQPRDELGSGSSEPPRAKSGSPRDQYTTAVDQIQTLDDQVEFELYAAVLTNRCRSVDDAMLGQLRPNDFRKALRLYNAMKCLTNGLVSVEEGKRFNEDIYDQVIKLDDEVKGMCSVDEDPGPAMEHLFKWIQKAPPELEKWLSWVEVNGSRGLGSELAHTREASGARSRFFVPMDDRKEGEIADVFNIKAKSNSPQDLLIQQVRQYTGSLMHLMGEDVYQHKARVGMQLLKILEGNAAPSTLVEVLQENPEWETPELNDEGIKGGLKDIVTEALPIIDPDQQLGLGSVFKV